jgi:predicted cobalt transporter CbtA
MMYVRLALVFLHLVGLALLLGGFAVQVLGRQLRINTAMVYGVATQLVTGFLLAAPFPDRAHQPEPAKLAVKAIVAIVIAAMVLVVRKKRSVAAGHFYAIGGMTLLNMAVALFWR